MTANAVKSDLWVEREFEPLLRGRTLKPCARPFWQAV